MADQLFSVRKNNARQIAGCCAVLLAIFVLLQTIPARASDAGYFSALPDLPLPPSFIEDMGAALSFETGSARIVEGVAHGPAGTDISAFYRDSLPMLGWQALGPRRYSREGEVLTLTPQRQGGQQILAIRLEPAP
jgi:hypothetical protein